VPRSLKIERGSCRGVHKEGSSDNPGRGESGAVNQWPRIKEEINALATRFTDQGRGGFDGLEDDLQIADCSLERAGGVAHARKVDDASRSIQFKSRAVYSGSGSG
jgi:hypothetical protein